MGASTPLVAFAVGGSLVVGGDAGDWWLLGVGEQLTELGATGPVGAAVQAADGALAVAGWSAELSLLRETTWSTMSLASPATALAATSRGLILADASGGLSLLATGSGTPVQELSARQAVLALAPASSGGLALMLADGTVATTAWPGLTPAVDRTVSPFGGAAPVVEAHPRLSPVDTSAVGRVHALFARPFADSGAVLVAGARGLGVLEGHRLSAVASDLGDRVACAAPFTGSNRALVACDNGDAFVIDPRLSRTTRGTGPVATGIAGVAAADPNHVLAWTMTGALLVISHGGASHRLTDGHIALAAPEVGRIGAIGLSWTANSGLRARRGLAWT